MVRISRRFWLSILLVLSLVLGLLPSAVVALAEDGYPHIVITNASLEVKQLTSPPAPGDSITGTLTIYFSQTGTSPVEPTATVTFQLIVNDTVVLTEMQHLDLDLPGNISNVIKDLFTLTVPEGVPQQPSKVRINTRIIPSQDPGNVIVLEQVIYQKPEQVSYRVINVAPGEVIVGETQTILGEVEVGTAPAGGVAIKVISPSGEVVAETTSAADGTFSVAVSFGEEGKYLICPQGGGQCAKVLAKYIFSQLSPTVNMVSVGQTVTIHVCFSSSDGSPATGVEVGLYKDGSLLEELGSTVADGCYSGRMTFSDAGLYEIGLVGSNHNTDYGFIAVYDKQGVVTAVPSEVAGGESVHVALEPASTSTIYYALEDISSFRVLRRGVASKGDDFDFFVPAVDGDLWIMVYWQDASGNRRYGWTKLTYKSESVSEGDIIWTIKGLPDSLKVGRVYSATVSVSVPSDFDLSLMSVEVTGSIDGSTLAITSTSSEIGFQIFTTMGGNVVIKGSVCNGDGNCYEHTFTYPVGGYVVSPVDGYILDSGKFPFIGAVGEYAFVVIEVTTVGGAPVEGAMVIVQNSYTADAVLRKRTDEDGLVRISTAAGMGDLLVPGVFDLLVVSSDGSLMAYLPKAIGVYPPSLPAVYVVPDTASVGEEVLFTVLMPRHSELKVYSPSGEKVYESYEESMMHTVFLVVDEEGVYRFVVTNENGMEGEWPVFVGSPTCHFSVNPSPVVVGRKTEIDFRCELKGVDYPLDMAVLRAFGGAKVEIENGGATLTETSSGKWVVKALDVSGEAGLGVRLFKGGKIVAEEKWNVVVPSIRVLDQNFDGEGRVVLKLNVTDPEGRPVSGVEVIAKVAGVEKASGVTDNGGKTTLAVEGVSPGDTIALYCGEMLLQRVTVTAEAADTIPPQIVSVTPPSGEAVFTSTVPVKVEVKDEGGSGVAAIHVDGVKYATVPQPGLSSAEFTITLHFDAPGAHMFALVVSDNAGNLSKPYLYKLVYKPCVSIKLYIEKSYYLVNGEKKSMDVAPFIDPRYGRTVVPIRFVAEALGLKVSWDASERKVIITGSIGGRERVVELFMGKHPKKVELVNPKDGWKRTVYEGLDKAVIDGKTVKLTNYNGQNLGVPFIYKGRTMVPLRFVAEIFGAQVKWIPEARAVEITLGQEN